MKKKLRIFREESGQALVGFALLLSLLLGFSALVVDVGAMYVQKRELQNAADSAALAGAAELQQNGTSSVVTAQVEAYLKENLQTSNYEVEIETSTTQVEVRVTQKTTNYFASFLNADPSNVTAAAAAEAVKPISIEGLRPWAVEAGMYAHGAVFDIKEGGGDGVNGFFNIIDFEGKSSNAKEYEDWVLNGYSKSISIGTYLDKTSGNKNNVKDVLGDIINNKTYPNNYRLLTAGDPRIITVPAVEISSDKKDNMVKVVGFAVIYLTAYDNKGNVTAVMLYDTTWTDDQKQDMNSFGLEGDVHLVK